MTAVQFTALVKQYQGLVYTVCKQLVQNPDLAEDLAQETFLSAWRSIDRCPAGYEKQWLAKIAANKARDHLKSAWARRVSAPGDDILELSPTPPGQLPEELVQAAAGEQQVRELILALREPYKTPAQLYFLQECSVEETARRCGRPPKTVSSQLARAKKMLREQILGSERLPQTAPPVSHASPPPARRPIQQNFTDIQTAERRERHETV